MKIELNAGNFAVQKTMIEVKKAERQLTQANEIIKTVQMRSENRYRSHLCLIYTLDIHIWVPFKEKLETQQHIRVSNKTKSITETQRKISKGSRGPETKASTHSMAKNSAVQVTRYTRYDKITVTVRRSLPTGAGFHVEILNSMQRGLSVGGRKLNFTTSQVVATFRINIKVVILVKRELLNAIFPFSSRISTRVNGDWRGNLLLWRGNLLLWRK